MEPNGAYNAKPTALMCIGVSYASIGYPLSPKIKLTTDGKFSVDKKKLKRRRQRRPVLGTLEFPFESILFERRAAQKPFGRYWTGTLSTHSRTIPVSTIGASSGGGGSGAVTGVAIGGGALLFGFQTAMIIVAIVDKVRRKKK